MSAKPVLFTLCVAWATCPWAALAQQTSTPTADAGKPAATTRSEGSAPKTASRGVPATSATHTSAASAAWAHRGQLEPGYAAPFHPGPSYLDGEFAYGHEGGCVDGACYDDFGWHVSDWICYPRLAHWGSVEYLLWWRKGEFLPPLVSTGPLNAANAQVLFGDGRFDFGPQPGGRVTAGVWLDDFECWGIGGRFFGLAEGEVDFRQTAAPGEALARPFIDPNTGTFNAVDLVGNLGGAIELLTRSEVYGGDALFRKRVECAPVGRLDWVFGYQFSRINEDLLIQTSTTLPPGPPNALNVFDHFRTKNEFHGGVLGLQAELEYGRLLVGLLTKVGLGNMRETVAIDGGGNPANSGLQGLLAQNTNIGVFTREEFAAVPEVNLNLAYRVTEHFDVTAGYSMLYWSHVVRPGEQVDLVVDTLPPVEGRPRFQFDASDFWVMGLNVGCQWSF